MIWSAPISWPRDTTFKVVVAAQDKDNGRRQDPHHNRRVCHPASSHRLLTLLGVAHEDLGHAVVVELEIRHANQEGVNARLRQFVDHRYRPFVDRCIDNRYATLALFLSGLVLCAGLLLGGVVLYVVLRLRGRQADAWKFRLWFHLQSCVKDALDHESPESSCFP